MKKTKNINQFMSLCLQYGIKVYPVYISKTKGKLQGNKWYIEVDNNGIKTTYAKSIGSGSVLSSKDCAKKRFKTKKGVDVENWCDAIEKVWKHWHDKIKEKNV